MEQRYEQRQKIRRREVGHRGTWQQDPPPKKAGFPRVLQEWIQDVVRRGRGE